MVIWRIDSSLGDGPGSSIFNNRLLNDLYDFFISFTTAATTEGHDRDKKAERNDTHDDAFLVRHLRLTVVTVIAVAAIVHCCVVHAVTPECSFPGLRGVVALAVLTTL